MYEGGLILGGTASGFILISSLSGGSILEIILWNAGLASAAVAGAALNEIRYSIKAEESFKIDQDNWKIIVK